LLIVGRLSSNAWTDQRYQMTGAGLRNAAAANVDELDALQVF
jgi:hypothetical protein